MLCEAFGEQRAGFQLHLLFKAGRVPVQDGKYSGRPNVNKGQKMLNEFEISSTKTVTEQSMSSQILFGSIMEFTSRP
jgi:hypothetical protein